MKTQKAIFAAGCFWGVQYYFDQVPGVVSTTVGYTGGHTESPTYDEVCTHLTGHAEALLVVFNPAVVSYEVLLKHFFRLHDPTLRDSDGVNHGNQYRSAVFYFDAEQHKLAVQSRNIIQRTLDEPVVTEIAPASQFYEAEDYHQKFTERTGIGMCHAQYRQIS